MGEHADAALAELEQTARLVGTSPLRAAAALAAGVVEAAAGEHERARVLLEDAVDLFAACGAPYEGALARLQLAATLTALKRAEVAEREAGAARRVLEQLGAASPGEQVADRTGGPETGDLTPRETEVLRLVAEGLTNEQIARRLVISPHTVHRHVTNVLAKLHLPSRTAAATHAARAGLLD